MKKLLLTAILFTLTFPVLSAAMPQFDCAGTEPFWGLKIKPSSIAFTRENVVTQLQVVSPQHSNATWTYNTHALSNMDPVTIVIEKMDCSDGMSDKTYTHKVTYTGTQTFSGCCDVKKTL